MGSQLVVGFLKWNSVGPFCSLGLGAHGHRGINIGRHLFLSYNTTLCSAFPANDLKLTLDFFRSEDNSGFLQRGAFAINVAIVALRVVLTFSISVMEIQGKSESLAAAYIEPVHQSFPSLHSEACFQARIEVQTFS